jgi:Family of unknown function (DUF6166)
MCLSCVPRRNELSETGYRQHAQSVIYHSCIHVLWVGTVSTFEGKRTIDGLVVTVDGKRLDEHYDVQRFTTWGFEWTYEGDSPKQLALALLVEHLKDNARAIRLTESFMRSVVANLDNDWVLQSSDVDRAIRDIESK